uniref:Uncharacterized protein n=1 Tax=Oryza meridionalis TaxID=40149 RepID=A0A0E0E7W8_9ORYZ
MRPQGRRQRGFVHLRARAGRGTAPGGGGGGGRLDPCRPDLAGRQLAAGLSSGGSGDWWCWRRRTVQIRAIRPDLRGWRLAAGTSGGSGGVDRWWRRRLCWWRRRSPSQGGRSELQHACQAAPVGYNVATTASQRRRRGDILPAGFGGDCGGCARQIWPGQEVYGQSILSAWFFMVADSAAWLVWCVPGLSLSNIRSPPPDLGRERRATVDVPVQQSGAL